jgi:hypothetical protein
MVVAEGPNEYILYAQNDHGDLAGQFAAHWGNETFSPLKPALRPSNGHERAGFCTRESNHTTLI